MTTTKEEIVRPVVTKVRSDGLVDPRLASEEALRVLNKRPITTVWGQTLGLPVYGRLPGIEQAYNDGKVEWKKPISCHLYPIRLKAYSQFTAMNYNKWSICDAACALGASLEVPVYKFVKEALIRKFGADWYAELEGAAKAIKDK